jgi:outer membrane protein assembly factor BamB
MDQTVPPLGPLAHPMLIPRFFSLACFSVDNPRPDCRRFVIACLVLFGGVGLAGLPASMADDWPQWRGENRDGVWRETGIVDQLPDGPLPRKWSVPVGSGYSGPTVADGRVFLTDRQVSVVDGREQERERVLCFDAETGRSIWSHTYDAPYGAVGYKAGPRASVTVDDSLAISVGATGMLFCFDAATGDIRWSHDLQQRYAIEMPNWGIAGAPLVHDGKVIQIVGGSKGTTIVAFDRETGEEVWRALDEAIGYSSPIVIRQSDRDVVVCWTGESVTGLDPRDGAVFWSIPFPSSRMPIGIATPIVEDDRLFVTSFYDGSLMLRVPKDRLDAEILWQFRGPDERQTEALHSIISTPVMDDGYIYGVDSYGELRCLDAATGKRIWEDDSAVPRARWATIHFVKRANRYWMFNDQGVLTVAQLDPQGYHPLSRCFVIDPTTDQLPRRDGVTWSHPAFANRAIFIRNDRELISASLAADATP